MKHLKKFKTLTVLLALLFSSHIQGQISFDGLIAYYPFNGNANDESNNGNDGTVSGALLVEDRFGNLDSAYEFDGVNDYIEINDTPSLRLSNTDLTISAWVYLPAYATNFQSVILSKRTTSAGNNGYVFIVKGEDAIPPGYLSYESSGGSDPQSSTVGVVGLNEWTHVLVKYDNSTGELHSYLNGVFDSTSSGILSPNNVAANLFIGKDGLLNTYFFGGKIDDIGIWDRALTDEEIGNLYNEGICYQTITVTDTLIINTGTLSYNPVTYNNTFLVYPNPANTEIIIDNGNINSVVGYALEIKNSLAQSLFFSEVNQQQFTVDISTWQAGMYFIHVYNENSQIIDIRKIIIQ